MLAKHPVHGWGHDLKKPHRGPITRPPRRPAKPLPPRAVIDFKFLPPAGFQWQIPSCWVWSSTYGVVTVEAAIKGGYSPATPADQASTTFTYVKVLQAEKITEGDCAEGDPARCFEYLKASGGVPTMAAATTAPLCELAWQEYAAAAPPVDPRFHVEAWKTISIKGKAGLAHLRSILARGKPLAYCTSLYTGFEHYAGTPSPYVGSGVLEVDAKGHPLGHCMMIVGYDDAKGAVLLLNSFGSRWGETIEGRGGYCWMAYASFQALARGEAHYVTGVGKAGG